MILLARYAESIFWLARYIERTENLARILDVNETFTRGSRRGQDWHSIIRLFADEERFAETHRTATATSVMRFYLLDSENPSSILSCVGAARENARALRPLLSTEMWTHLNVFYNELRAMDPSQVTLATLPRLCQRIKEQCQAHAGVTEGTFFRDQGWHFYELGRHLERADQTTRLIDIKYQALQPMAEEPGSPLDVSQWNAVLRSAAGYHSFRRVHPRGMSPRSVAGFLLFDPRFPRSMAFCVERVESTLHALRTQHGLRRGIGALERLDEIRGVIEAHTIDIVLADGLHEFADWFQRQIIGITIELGQDFFGQLPEDAEGVGTAA